MEHTSNTTLAADGAPSAPFHAGERALQARLAPGLDERMAELGAVVLRDHMPDQHRAFFAQLPWLLAGGIDDGGQPWATALAGAPGFLRTPDARHLRVDALPAPDDPLHAALRPGAALGLLGIEPPTRRRNRLNGRVLLKDAGGFTLSVGQSFGNCPKYIQARVPLPVAPLGPEAPGAPVRGDGLDDAARALIARADTFFIASAHPDAAAQAGRPGGDPAQGVDMSHRGGPAGLVRVEGDTLTVPDFAGNRFFNTLGNLVLQPRCGLLFVDPDSGGLLHLAAEAELAWDDPARAGFPGAERLLVLRVRQRVWRPRALPLRWGPARMSPFLEGLGPWRQAA